MKVKIGDKEFDLKPFTLNDWIKLEDMGVEINEMGKGKINFKNMRDIVYCALYKVDNSVEKEWVGENLQLNSKEMTDIVNFISPKESAKEGQ